MKAVDALKSVLCGPDGKCCIAGSQADRDTVDTALAAIQHYLDQHKAELPVLPDHPEPRTMKWSALEIEAIQAYGAACAAHARELALSDASVTNDDLKEMESKVDYWREKHADLGLKYDNLLQSFHIAETDAKLWKGAAEKARVDALEEAATKITPPDVMMRTDGRTYGIAKVLAEAIRKMKAGK